MKIIQFFAFLALVPAAAWATTNEKDEVKRAKGEMAELTNRMARHLREGHDSRAFREHAKKMRRVHGDEDLLDSKRSEKQAANAEKIRKVADGVKKQQREAIDPRLTKMDGAKLAKHSKAAAEGDESAKREKAAVNAESMKHVASQIPKEMLSKPGREESEKLKTLPDVKKAGNGVKESAARAKKVAPGSMKGAQEKIEKMSKRVKAAQDEDNEN